MKHLMTLLALVVAVTAGAQTTDSEISRNTMILDYEKLDSIIRDLQAKVAILEEAQAKAFNGDYNNLSNQPNLFDGDYRSLTGVPTLAAVATSGSYTDLSNQLTQKDIVEAAYSLNKARLWDANLSNANLSNAYLRNAALADANLSDANFSNADLRWANLSKAGCIGTNFSGASLVQADLTGARFGPTDFSNANLRWANLSNTSLSAVWLEGADLTNANLTGVKWRGAYVKNCSGCYCVDANNDNYCD